MTWTMESLKTLWKRQLLLMDTILERKFIRGLDSSLSGSPLMEGEALGAMFLMIYPRL